MGTKHANVKRLVVKVGTGFLFDKNEGQGNGYKFLPEQMDALTQELALISERREVALVSSGAIATAACEFGLPIPASDYEKAQLSGMGQPVLMQQYRERFAKYGRHCAQCLLTHDDIIDVNRRRNLRTVLDGYLRDGIIPVVNENDTISIEEISFGDNDILAAMLTDRLDANLLVILSYAVDGLGTGGGESKTRARGIVQSCRPPRPMKVIRERYAEECGAYKPLIRHALEGEDVGTLLEV